MVSIDRLKVLGSGFWVLGPRASFFGKCLIQYRGGRQQFQKRTFCASENINLA